MVRYAFALKLRKAKPLHPERAILPFWILERLIGRRVINAGLNGDTIRSALVRLQSDVLKKEPYLVIVELAGNDFLQRISKKKGTQDASCPFRANKNKPFVK